ncbi:MAG: multi-sensor hybrid histidine kinase [Verrucomicrobiaceae bacterium]|nr:multi-sensor hybrid histidine kinase [Verrucomicrobiaceae bacterium]
MNSTGAAPQDNSEVWSEIGHELRGPLTGILAFADALQYEVFGPLTPGQKQALLSIRESAQRQTDLVADLMDLRRLETGILSLTPVSCRLSETLEQSLGKAAELLSSRSVHLSSEIVPENLSACVDAKRLEQIVTHLVMAGLRAADTQGVAHLTIRPASAFAGISLTFLVAPPGGLPTRPETGPSDAAVEQRLRKLGPVGLLLLKALLALHGGELVTQEIPAGCLSLTASLPCALCQ